MNTLCDTSTKALDFAEARMESKKAIQPNRFRSISLIAAKELGDCFRSGWVMAGVAVWLGAIGLTSLFGLVQIGHVGWQGYERTVISLLNVVQYLVPLLGLLLGHDLIVSEREERTLSLLLATGLSRSRLLIGKFFGGCLSLTLPLMLGFAISGTVIGLAAKDSGIKPFVTLAFSGITLGVVFLAIGLLISTFCRTRVQSLVFALLAWCLAVFVFDLVALGLLISTKAPQAAREIDIACDTMHVNAAADIHNAFDTSTKSEAVVIHKRSSFNWMLVNPVDLFRAVNLSKQMNVYVPLPLILATVLGWVALSLALSVWKLRRIDL